MSVQNMDHPAVQTAAGSAFVASIMGIVPAITAVAVLVYYILLISQTERAKQLFAWLRSLFAKKPPPDPDYSAAS
jgi:hypothetical protein